MEKITDYKKYKIFLPLLFFFVFLLISNKILLADKETESIKKDITNTIDIHKKAQVDEESWAIKKEELINELENLYSEKKRLERIELLTKEKLKQKKQVVAEFLRKIRETARLKDELAGYLDHVIIALESFIERDRPFLVSERKNRIKSIRETLTDSESPDAENTEEYLKLFR